MLATSLRRTALSAAKKSSCINTTAAATTTSRCFASAPVDFDHFSSGWEKDSSEYKTEGKFHIETFNKISPLVSFPFFFSYSSIDVMAMMCYHIYSYHILREKEVQVNASLCAYSIVGFNNL